MPREFGACTSYLSIAAYRSDAHHLLANVMVSPITGRRSSARSGNDRAPRGWPECPNRAGSRDEAPRRCIIQTGWCNAAGGSERGMHGCPPLPTQTANSSQWMHYMALHGVLLTLLAPMPPKEHGATLL